MGINGSQGPPGRPGASNFTVCQYKNKKGLRGAASAGAYAAYSDVHVRDDEYPVRVILNLDIYRLFSVIDWKNCDY